MRRTAAVTTLLSFSAGSLPVAAALPACGPEVTAATSTTAVSDESSGEDAPDDETQAWLIVSAILVASTVIGLVSYSVDDQMFAYMREHRGDMRRALAAGSGPFPSDLGASLALPERDLPRLRALLREGRGALATRLDEAFTADGAVDPAAARAFWSALLARLAADPVLAPRLERAERRAHDLFGART